MGYRHRFYKIPKSEVEKVKNMTYDELLNYAIDNDCSDIYEEDIWFIDDEFLNKEEVYDLGKLYFNDTAERIYSKGAPLFENEETQKCFIDYDPFIVGKEGLIEAIDIYTEKTLDYYKSFFKNGKDYQGPFKTTFHKEDVNYVDEIINHLQDRIDGISMRGIVNIEEDANYLTSSWDYEYAVFNLAFLLKTIDWDKYTIMICGW